MQNAHHMAKWLLIPIIPIFLLATGCKKEAKENDTPTDVPGPFKEIPADRKLLVTPKAATTGAKVSKVIGPAGGTLTSEDGDFGIEVPAGAVTTATTFSIQPVENTLQKNSGKTSYEVLPHNVTFQKPVKITIAYDMDVFSENADALQVASREESSGKWIALPTALDADEGTLTVEKNSFSIFEYFEKYRLFAEKDALDAGESTPIYVGIFDSVIGANGSDDLLSPLIPNFADDGINYYKITGKSTIINNWTIVEGPGTVAPNLPNNAVAKYTAPATLSEDYAIVQVTLTNMPPVKDPKAPGGIRNGGKLYLREQISLLRSWVKVTMNGMEYFLKGEVSAGAAGSKTWGIGGKSVVDGVGEIIAFVAVIQGEGVRPKAGSYKYGTANPGDAVAGVNIMDQPWSSQYYDCDSYSAKPSGGSADFKTWGGAEKIIEGSTTFTANLMVSECDKTTKRVSISWHIPLD